MTRLLPFALIVPLAACGLQIPFIGGDRASGPTVPEVAIDPLPETDAAPEAIAAGALGTTLASLGDATVQGLWLETPLVSAPGPGRVTADGASVDVQLIPSGGLEGAGSRLSLAAMQALGLPLTAIAEVSVEAL